MPGNPYPRIQPDDYPRLLELIEEYSPQALGEWQAEHGDWEGGMSERLKYDRSHNQEPDWYDVRPEDFIEWCRESRRDADLMALQRYVEHIDAAGGGQVIDDWDPLA